MPNLDNSNNLCCEIRVLNATDGLVWFVGNDVFSTVECDTKGSVAAINKIRLNKHFYINNLMKK